MGCWQKCSEHPERLPANAAHMMPMTTSPAPASSPSTDPIIETIAAAMAMSDGVSLDDTRMAGDYRKLARAAFEAVIQGRLSTKERVGLQHENGYVYECNDLREAQDFKSGKRIQGRRGDWKDHTIVARSTATVGSSWATVEV